MERKSSQSGRVNRALRGAGCKPEKALAGGSYAPGARFPSPCMRIPRVCKRVTPTAIAGDPDSSPNLSPDPARVLFPHYQQQRPGLGLDSLLGDITHSEASDVCHRQLRQEQAQALSSLATGLMFVSSAALVFSSGGPFTSAQWMRQEPQVEHLICD